MSKNATLHKLFPAVFAVALFPLVSGCAFTARGVVRPPRVAIVANVPPPPSGRVVIRAGGSASATHVVHRDSAGRAASASARVEAAAPAPQPPAIPASPAPPAIETTTDISSAVPAVNVDVDATAPSWDGITLGEALTPVSVTVPPPAPPATAVAAPPPPRAGFIWVRGHYGWSGTDWVWRPARWARELPGHTYVAPRYDANRRVWIRGHWAALASAEDTMTLNTMTRPPRPQDLLPTPAPSAAAQLHTPAPPSVSLEARAGFDARVSGSFGR